MRNTFSILLLLVFFTGNAGYYIFFAYQQQEMKEAMERRILAAVPDSLLELIVAEEKASFRWEEEGTEFYQDGQMYDVVRSVVKNNKTLLYCINDKKETQLLLHLSKTVSQQNGKGERQSNQIQVIDLFFQPMGIAINTAPVVLNKYFDYNITAIALYIEVHAPPPRA